jgi:hypothetical protein
MYVLTRKMAINEAFTVTVAMIWPGPSLASSDAEPNSHSDNEGYQPPTGALSQG